MSDKDGSLYLSARADATGVAGTIKVSRLGSILRFMFPEHHAKGLVLEAVAENINRQLAAGKPLSSLTNVEHTFVAAALSGQFEKVVNATAIVQRAVRHEPQLKELFESRELPQLPESTAEEVANPVEEPAQYFWDRFWADAEVVSVEYMQELYARILAGQIRKPTGFSLRTLDVIRYLDEDIARMFYNIRGFVVMGFALPNMDSDVFGIERLAYANLLRMAEAGLIQSHESTLKSEFGREQPILMANVIVMVHPESRNPNGADVYALTKAGSELHATFDADYSKKETLLNWFKAHAGRILVTQSGQDLEEWDPPTS